MRVAGVDPSSSSAGFALVVDGRILVTDVWRPEKHRSPQLCLLDYFQYIYEELYEHTPDLLVIEIIAFTTSMTTTRILSRYEAMAILAAKQLGITVKEHRVSEARAIVFGNGSIKKRDAYNRMVAEHSYHKFGKPNKAEGGEDEADAAAMALAGPGLVEK